MSLRYPLPYAFARENLVLLERSEGESVLRCAPETALSVLAEATRSHGVDRCEPETEAALKSRIAQAYAADVGSAASVVDEVESQIDLLQLMNSLPATLDLLESEHDAPIIRMLNVLLMQAAREGASDIHIEPYEKHSAVRFRVDGLLREIVQPHGALHSALISRLKIMADLDISEKRLPQDGRISLRVAGRAVDVRVSTLPAAHGERAVLRLLDKGGQRPSLDTLGIPDHILPPLRQALRQPHGLLLVTGPTGSGKTTTLYAALGEMDTKGFNILTVEDPIEYELPGIGQTQVQPKIDLSFARALRALLRQDPDVIMIGEIRDQETAQIAIQASLTGHLVLATLHTNGAIPAIMRLQDMGIEPYLISASLLGVMGQRLVRRRCLTCEGRGCEACAQSGWKGRTGLYEWLPIDETLREAIHRQAPESELIPLARASSWRPMKEHGDDLVAQGITTHEEVLRVTRDVA